MKCDVCKTESDFDAGFIKERRSFRTSQKIFCPACWVRRHQKTEGSYQIAVVVGGIVGYTLLWLNPRSFAGHFLTAIFLINLFLILSIIPHELGHAGVARLLGWRVFQIVIGVGKTIYRRTFCGIIFDFHWLPIGGITQLMPVDVRWLRVKRFFIVLAGPMVNAVFAFAALLIYRGNWHSFDLFALPRELHFFVMANLWVLVINLWPIQFKAFGLPSDGKQLLQMLSFRKKDQEELLVMRYALEALLRREYQGDLDGARDWCDKGLAMFPENLHLLNISGILWLDQMDYDRAREIFIKLLAREDDAARTRYTILNNIAYADALTNKPEWLPEADAYSKQAYTALPWVPAFVGTRGTVLVAMGQFEEGIKLLKQSFEGAWSPRSKAENACHLALAHVRTGNQGDAQKYLEVARQLDSHCKLINRAEVELGGSVSLAQPC
jgi:tetratricopeptide (TPR) repeat protein